MAFKNITAVTFDQLQALLTYCVARVDANGSNAFEHGAQYFLDTSENKLRIYNGAGTVQYDSSTAIGSLVYLNGISYESSEYAYVFYWNDHSQSSPHKYSIYQADWDAQEGSGAFIRNKPTIPAAQVNSDWNATSGVAAILNKPSIPAAQVNSDWNATSGVAQILNKPTIPAAPVNADWNATSGLAEILNKPTIPAAPVNADWNATSGLAQILNKPTIPAAPVNADWNATSGLAQILNKPTIPAAVSGANDGTNWTSITIGSDTYAIPAGGSGTPSDYIKSMSAANNTLSWTEVVNGTETQQSYTFSGGGGGTSNYADLSGKPQIGGVTLASGNNTLAALGLQALIDASHKLDYSLLDNTPTIPDAVSGVNDGTNWTSITIGNVTKAIPSGGGGTPSTYIKSISKSGRTLTWTKQDDSTDSLDTSYSDATQSTSGLMSATDKTKLDGLVSNKADVLFSGLVDGGTSTDLPAATINQYAVILMTVHSQYADAHKRTVAIPVASIGNFSIQETIQGWNDPLNVYIYFDSDYLRCNGGSGHILYITSVIGFKA